MVAEATAATATATFTEAQEDIAPLGVAAPVPVVPELMPASVGVAASGVAAAGAVAAAGVAAAGVGAEAKGSAAPMGPANATSVDFDNNFHTCWLEPATD
jgi:hypothetical protein